MRNGKQGRYTLEFKQEAARLVESGKSQAAAARSLGVVEQTLGNWVREHRAGTLKGASSKPQVSTEQMENSRPRAELARVTLERDILHPTDEDLSAGPRPGKSDGVLCEAPEMKYAFIQRNKLVWSDLRSE